MAGAYFLSKEQADYFRTLLTEKEQAEFLSDKPFYINGQEQSKGGPR